jgi:putative transcriptional regulator
MVQSLEGYLNGNILVAMPLVADVRLEQTIVFVCGHDDHGAIGLILNKQLPSVLSSELFKQLHIPYDPAHGNRPLYFGGSVEMNRGFVLHSLDYLTDNTVVVSDDYGVTATVDILRSIATGIGPKEYRISLGYTGWSSGQLEQDLQDNRWLICPPSKDFIFETRSQEQWQKAYQNIGYERGCFPMHGGRA